MITDQTNVPAAAQSRRDAAADCSQRQHHHTAQHSHSHTADKCCNRELTKLYNLHIRVDNTNLHVIDALDYEMPRNRYVLRFVGAKTR